MLAAPASAQTYATGNGDWSTASTWTNGIPTTFTFAFIGSTSGGGAANATVTLSQSVAAGPLTLAGPSGTTGTLDLGPFNMSVGSLSLGSGNASILRSTGLLSIGSLSLQSNSNFAYAAGDGSTFLSMQSNGTVTTAGTGNISGNVNLESGSLVLGANLTLTQNLNANGNSVVNAQGRAITAASISIGFNGTPAQLLNDGAVTAGSYLQSSSNVTLSGGNDTVRGLNLAGNAILRVSDVAGQATGLTLDEPTNVLSIAAGSKLRLDLVNEPGWVFRWKNATGGNHVADLNALIADGRIDFVNPGANPVFVTTDTDYTYISVVPVPEPALALLGLPAAAWLSRRRRTRLAKS